MGYTKRDFIKAAFEELGIADYIFDLEAEQLESALRRLDSMMASWNAEGLRIGYPIPTSPNESDLDESSSVPDSANEAIILNLAIRIAPSFGKLNISPDTRINAKNALNALRTQTVNIPEMQYIAVSRGSGHKPYRTNRPFIEPTDDTLDAGNDGEIQF